MLDAMLREILTCGFYNKFPRPRRRAPVQGEATRGDCHLARAAFNRQAREKLAKDALIWNKTLIPIDCLNPPIRRIQRRPTVRRILFAS
jgi:hypothetical protein